MTATSLQYQAIHPDLLIGTFTVAEYLDIERSSGERHEFYNGKIIRIAGGSVDHNRISRNVLCYLSNELDKKAGFELFGSDQKVYLPKIMIGKINSCCTVPSNPLKNTPLFNKTAQRF